MNVNRLLYDSGQWGEIVESLSSSQNQTPVEYMEAVRGRAVIYNSSTIRIDSTEHFVKDMIQNSLISLGN